MASTYTRPNSKFIWIRYRDAAGTWKRKSSGKLADNANDKREADMMARRLTLKEQTTRVVKSASNWESWVPAWIESKWGGHESTAVIYRIRWGHIQRFMAHHSISVPAGVTRAHTGDYLTWRATQGIGRNTSIQELFFLSQVLKEAVRRGYATENAAKELGLKKDDPEEKSVWSEDEIANVGDELYNTAKFGWMHVTFLMGLHQAVRIRQSQVPLTRIDFSRRIIDYPANIVKGGKAYAQPIAPDFFNTLFELVEHRKALGETKLCDVPLVSGFKYRHFLDELGLKHLCHHGLRATWITRAALAGVPESLAMRFSNHSSSLVHKIYQKITADDLLPMLDAMRLKRIEQGQRQAPALPGSPTLTEATS